MDLKIFTENIEPEAKGQVYDLLKQAPFKDSKVRIMPDVHAGKGCVIGFTGNLGDKVIPNIVGVDIGCGMLCIELGKINLDLKKLDTIIREVIPSGRNIKEESGWFNFENLRCYKKLKNIDWLKRSQGTLGGGNHFIEIDIDEEGNKYLIIHTGSRNLGKQVAELYQDMAIANCSYGKVMNKEINDFIQSSLEDNKKEIISAGIEKIREKYKDKLKLPREMCYLEGQGREDYLYDMKICQDFARENRRTISMDILMGYFGLKGNDACYVRHDGYSLLQVDFKFYKTFETVHNYIDIASNIVRKGAISAQKGEKVLIPMNMRDGCLIAIGKGNEDWNCSAPHGAGRIMSRSKAKEAFGLEEFEKSMEGIYTTSVNSSTIDEAPMVYKPMQEIIDNIGDTVDIERIIKPIYNFKASE